ncbi:ATP-binding protein [Solirubrobacter deserti]|uniref:ATP-binding protein n=1 Tax=Solirubrobacter deserti TaxID=2282478 RepID=A0ABT4RM31_9ACTN|nr:ATP-binding protein [Solirubrobacter deserti]MDA0139623.1 ATP-binding protein [Solirubrobacter deserti]
MEAHVLDLTLPPEPTSVAQARTTLCEAMAQDLRDTEVETVKLLISELVTNAVRHGDGREPVEVHAHWNAEVRVEVSDRGRGFAPDPRIRPFDDPGGYGLFLVGALADRWGVETDEGTTVWFVLQHH